MTDFNLGFNLRKKMTFFVFLFFLSSISACENGKEKIDVKSSSNKTSAAKTNRRAKEKIMTNISIYVDGKKFEAILFDNPSGNAFAKKLPLTLNMTELNGNEKYFRFSEKFPSNDERPEKIKTGDLMLFSSSYFVIFYENTETFYAYTPLGKIKNPQGLAKAFGAGSISVTIKAD